MKTFIWIILLVGMPILTSFLLGLSDQRKDEYKFGPKCIPKDLFW